MKNENIRDSFIRFPIVTLDQSRQMLICHSNLSSSRNLRGRGNFYEGIVLPVLTRVTLETNHPVYIHHSSSLSSSSSSSSWAIVKLVTQLYSLAFTFSPFARGQKESSTRRPRNYEFAHGTCRSAKIVQIYAQLVCSRDGGY